MGIQWAYGKRSLVIKTEEGYTGISDDDISECWVKPSKMEYIKRIRTEILRTWKRN